MSVRQREEIQKMLWGSMKGKAMVTQQELNHLGTDGYFIRQNVLSKNDVAIVKQTIEAALETPSDLRKGNYDPELKAREGDSILSERDRYRKLGQFARNTCEIVEHGIGHPNILSVCRHFLGDDVILLYDSIFLKLARTGGPTPWHQDIGLWPEKVPNAVNMWTAIDPATRENGCMQFVPGSHKEPVIEHVLLNNVHKELPPEVVKDAKTVHIELDPGDTVFWHSNLWHYSGPNTSEKNRIAMAGVYIRPDAGRASPKCQGSMMWLMRSGQRCDFPLQRFNDTANAASLKSSY